MRFNFECAKFGKCRAETEVRSGHVRVTIWHGIETAAKKVEYEIQVSGPQVTGEIPGGGKSEDAARIAANHFVQSSGSNHMTFRFPCTEFTRRWPGVFELVDGA